MIGKSWENDGSMVIFQNEECEYFIGQSLGFTKHGKNGDFLWVMKHGLKLLELRDFSLENPWENHGNKKAQEMGSFIATGNSGKTFPLESSGVTPRRGIIDGD